MKIRKEPMRTCVVTREKTNKMNLIRVVRTPEGNVIVDSTGKANGKGAYLTKDIEVINKAFKKRILDKVLEVEVPDTIYEELKEMI